MIYKYEEKNKGMDTGHTGVQGYRYKENGVEF